MPQIRSPVGSQDGFPASGLAEPQKRLTGTSLLLLVRLSLRLCRTWGGAFVIAVAALAMLSWTWGTWPDPLVDFGRQRYIPWRLAEGEVLYRDIAYYNGPLSQYFHALCFRLFGSSLRTLVLCNLSVLAIFITLLYLALCQVARRAAAAAAATIFVLLFAFAQYSGIGNFNYVCPYCYEVTHGLFLSLLAVVAAWPSGRHGMSLAIVSGAALGLALLTKAELFLPGAVATGVALALGLWLERPGWGRALGRLGCFLAASAAGPAIAFVALASAMPAAQALTGTLGSWAVIARSDVIGMAYFREGLGTDHLAANIWAMLTMTGLYAAVLAPAAGLGLALRPGRHRTAIAGVVFLAVAGGLWHWRANVDWSGIARPLPLLVLLAIAAVVPPCFFRRHGPWDGRRSVRQASLLVFALLLLGKMALNARIFHYGFALAMPASLLLSVAALDWIPALIDRRGGTGRLFAAASAALLAVIALVYLGIQAEFIGLMRERVGSGADAFWCDSRGAVVNAAVAQIASRSSPRTTLAVVHEGVMINCLAELRNPTPYINLTPEEVTFFGEQRILDAYQAHPPDLIALIHKDTSEPGPFFGREYGRRIAAWIIANYQAVGAVGAQPPGSGRFGILLLEKSYAVGVSARPRSTTPGGSRRATRCPALPASGASQPARPGWRRCPRRRPKSPVRTARP